MTTYRRGEYVTTPNGRAVIDSGPYTDSAYETYYMVIDDTQTEQVYRVSEISR